MAKRVYRGCKCQCGEGTYSTYAPGHDSRHVSQLVAMVIETWGTTETTTAWRLAIAQLDTYGLRAKFRTQMRRKASKHLDLLVNDMWDEPWQQTMRLRFLLAESDMEHFGNVARVMAPVTLAVFAAAMGWTRHKVNYRRS